MLVDFCHWSLQPSVTCDKPSCDGYEPQNLISKDFLSKNKGFLAENFIKPPINITFSFPCKICIKYIMLNPIVGAQKSTCIEIFTSCKRIPSSWLLREEKPGKPIFDSPFFMNIGKISLNEPSRICFIYPKFIATSPFSMETANLDNCVQCELRNPRHQYLTAVSELTIKIVRTHESSIPALKSVQIIGQPAVSNGKTVLDRVYSVFFPPVKCVSSEEEKPLVVTEEENESIEPSVDIPDEFIDPITCDIMALPVLLPSGKSLDQSTLEKYISTESSWGRGPSDPFTGVLFSTESRPRPNDSLKTRIDGFLLKNANVDHLKAVPRTLGRKSEDVRTTSQPTVSNLTERTSQLKRHYTNYSEECHSDQNKKRLRVEYVKDTQESCSSSQSTRSKGDNSLSTDASTSHQHKLDNSLNQALSLLHGLPSFNKRTFETKSQVISKTICVNCKSDTMTNAYRLKCSHTICRHCVLGSGRSVKCQLCGQTSLLADITRTHLN